MKVTGHTGPIANIELSCTLANKLPIEDGLKVIGFKEVTFGVLNAIAVHSVSLNVITQNFDELVIFLDTRKI